MSDDTYTHGHHDSVLRSHRWRTAENSAGYLLPALGAGMDLLDVGCGPGTITLDLGARVAPGRTVGIDRSAEVIAQTSAQAGPSNVSFATGDVYALPFEDESFDVVHTHQMLQHLTDPVAALRQMRRVLRRGGIVAARDSDYGGFVWGPGDALLDRWMQLYHQVCARNGADADAGRELPGWVRAAGFKELTVTSSTWTFSSAEDRAWWGDLWAERVVASAFAEQAVSYGLASTVELSAIASAWRRWAEHDDGLFIVLHAEVVARR